MLLNLEEPALGWSIFKAKPLLCYSRSYSISKSSDSEENSLQVGRYFLPSTSTVHDKPRSSTHPYRLPSNLQLGNSNHFPN
jgi:hypothetical protein